MFWNFGTKYKLYFEKKKKIQLGQTENNTVAVQSGDQKYPSKL